MNTILSVHVIETLELNSLRNIITHGLHYFFNDNLAVKSKGERKGKEMFYLTTHSTHFIYGYMASDIWLRTTQIVREESRCRHIGYSFRLAARVLWFNQERSTRRSISPRAVALPLYSVY